jgi:hypothetical protein
MFPLDRRLTEADDSGHQSSGWTRGCGGSIRGATCCLWFCRRVAFFWRAQWVEMRKPRQFIPNR